MQENLLLHRHDDVSTISDVAASDAAVYRRHKDALVRYATALVGRDEAADVLSTVVVRVLSRQRLVDLDEPRAYLYRAVLNESRSRLRWRSRFSTLDTDIETNGDGAPRPEVLEAVRRLSPQQRAATFLFYWMGCSTADTAELMGVRPGTVSRYLHLARNHLRSSLDA